MDPINKKTGCTPQSSNCVIWQGPDISCIKLCKGDSITDVTSKLATELCKILDTLNLTSYDLSCFNLGNCAPKDFVEFVQLLSDKVCALENVEPVDPTDPTYVEPILQVCSTFWTESLGNTIKELPLSDYVTAIGNKVCTIVGQIETINSILDDHEERIVSLEENTSNTNITVESTCLAPGTQQIDVLVELIETELCELSSATGNAAAIATAMAKACGLNAADKLYGTGDMSSIPGWKTTPRNLAESFSNLWLTVCDMRAAVNNMQTTCCSGNCSAIAVSMEPTLVSVNQISILFTGEIPSVVNDSPGGSTITLSNGVDPDVVRATLFIKSNYLNSSAYIINITETFDTTGDIVVKLDGVFVDTSTSDNCNILIEETIPADGGCPPVTIEPTPDTAAWSFTWIGDPINIKVDLLENIGLSVVQTVTIPNANGLNDGVFTGLTESTSYYIRLTLGTQVCSTKLFTTTEYPCEDVTITQSQDLTNPVGATTGSNIEAWQADYDANNERHYDLGPDPYCYTAPFTPTT